MVIKHNNSNRFLAFITESRFIQFTYFEIYGNRLIDNGQATSQIMPDTPSGKNGYNAMHVFLNNIYQGQPILYSSPILLK